MTLVNSIDKIVSWLTENVCSKITLKLPDDYRNDTGYDVVMVNPAAFPLYVPGKDRLPPNVAAPIPSVCVQLIDNGYTSEFSKVYWPKIKDGSGRIFWLSTVGAATMQRVDLSHDGVPFESPSNKEIMATSQYFGEDSKSRGFDQETANKLNEKGITTACFWGGRWVLWGPHTAAYKYNGSMDARAIFDVNIRMLEHITNSFQKDHGTEIDSPMTPQDKDSVLNFEKEKLDTLLGIGALIGTPSVEFVESANPTSNMLNGDFVWDFSVTNTPPFKSGTARVCYTDEGFQSFFATE